jgi:hypothetical protein
MKSSLATSPALVEFMNYIREEVKVWLGVSKSKQEVAVV